MTSILCLMSSLISSWAWAGSVDISVTLSPAGSFVAKSPSIQGQATQAPDGSYSAKNVILDISTLRTGIDLRDRHMREKYFEAAKFPKAILHTGTARQGRFEGELEVHGKRKKIQGTYAADPKSVRGKFKCALTDFGIAEANYMGVGVEDEVEVEVTLPVASAPAAPKPATPQQKPRGR